MNDKMWLTEIFDDIVHTSAEEGLTVECTRQRFIDAYTRAVETGQVSREQPPSLAEEARQLFDNVVMKERERRRGAFLKEGAWLIAALNDETVLGRQDPALDRAYRLGDGRDKTLRYWSYEDWATAVQMRYRKAADGAIAAREFDVGFASVIMSQLRSRGLQLTGQLYD